MLTYVCTVFEECKSIWRTIVEQCIIKRGSSIIKYSIQTTQKTATFPPLFFLLFLSFSSSQFRAMPCWHHLTVRLYCKTNHL